MKQDLILAAQTVLWSSAILGLLAFIYIVKVS